jgi:hypothetical protein
MPTAPAPLPSTLHSGSALRTVRPGNRTAERLSLAGAAVIGVLCLAAWQVPPLLDWSRYKAAIASYAGARLGRHVAIGGQVRLTLLPRAMLMADNVTLSDRGDGISARIGTLRLEVSLAGLFGGHVVPRALTLDNPVAAMPWPLPRAPSPGTRPGVLQTFGERQAFSTSDAFSATMEGGTLQLGGVRLTDIVAVFQTDPDTGAFDARGSAIVAGLPWRFKALVGAPGKDGIATLTLTLDGQAPYGTARGADFGATEGNPGTENRPGTGSSPDHAGISPTGGLRGTGGAFYGRILNDGTVAGRVVLRGPDLSQLAPAPPLPWQVQGDITGDAATVRAPALAILLGGAPGHADLALRLAAPASVDLHAALGQLPNADWAWRLLQDAPAAASRITAKLDLSASAISIAGFLVQSPHAVLSMGSHGAELKTASAILPGGARIDAAGNMPAGRAGFAGKLHVTAPDLRRTLQFLSASATDRLPKQVLTQADLQGDLSIAPGRIALTGLSGNADGSPVTGGLAFEYGVHPKLGIDLMLDKLDVDAWTGRQPATLSTIGAWAQNLAIVDTDLHLRAGTAPAAGLPFRNAVLDAHAGSEGLMVHRLEADLSGAHIEASGVVGADGTIADGRFDVAATDAGKLPASWRQPPKLWQGPFHLAANAAGPPQDMVAQIRADLGDLRAEAEAHIDQTAPRATATVTLRHPGAPRLLEALGWPGAETWLDHGSLAILAHLILSPGHVHAQDFSLSAAALHVDGAIDADLTGAVPSFTGHADAGTLMLPPFSPHSAAPLPWTMLQNLDADIHLRADRVTNAGSPDVIDAVGTLIAGEGIAVLDDAHAMIAGGHAAWAIAADATQNPPALSLQASLTGAAPDGIALAGRAMTGGTLDMSADLLSRGFGSSALLAGTSGRVAGSLHDISITNIDLPAIDALLKARRPKLRPLLEAALASGATAGLTGDASAAITGGTLRFDKGFLSGLSGNVVLSGAADAINSVVDMTLVLTPAVPIPPPLTLHFSGPGPGAPGSLMTSIDVSAALGWAGQPHSVPAKPLHRGRKN